MISFFVVPPMMGGGFAMIASAFILKIVIEGGYTMMNIGMGSLIGNMATNDSERAVLASARGFGSTLGGAVGSWSCFTFIWCINKDVRAKMAEWKAAK